MKTLLLSVIFIINVDILVAQHDQKFDCTFSKEKWLSDSTGSSGYRYEAMVAYQCPNLGSLDESLSGNGQDSLSLIQSLGKPNHIERQEDGRCIMTYDVYEKVFEDSILRMEIHFYLDRDNKVFLVLYSKIGG